MTNKVAVVSGGAMGYKSGGPSIGGAVSIKLARDGFNVVIVDEGEMGKKTEELVKKEGQEGLFIQADVTNTEDVKMIMSKTHERFGRLNCLVNCVARYSNGMAKNIADISEDEWNNTLNVNLNGYFKMIKYGIPLMKESGGGTIINLSSIEAFVALPNFSVYSVSKGAIDAMTRSLAVDFAPSIRTNSVVPGFVKIANSENDRSPDELKKWYEEISKQYPMRRVCTVEEIANVISFLAGSQSSFINGQTIVVDGGKLIADSHEF